MFIIIIYILNIIAVGPGRNTTIDNLQLPLQEWNLEVQQKQMLPGIQLYCLHYNTYTLSPIARSCHIAPAAA